MSEETTVKTSIEKGVLVAKVVYDRYPNFPVYLRDLEEVHDMVDHIFVDDPDSYKAAPEYTFEDWMNNGEKVVITMERVTQEFLDALEPFESY